MKKKLVIFVLFLFTMISINGLQPKPYNFQTPYQYKLFTDWTKFGKMKKEAQTILSEDLFILDFSIKRSNKQISTEFDTEDYKVFRLREVIFVNKVSVYQIPKEHLKILEDFLFRINSHQNYAISDFLGETKLEFSYNSMKNVEAIKAFIDNQTERFELKKITVAKHSKSVTYSYISKDNTKISVKIPSNKNQLKIASQRLRKLKKETKKPIIPKIEKVIITEKVDSKPLKEDVPKLQVKKDKPAKILNKPDEQISINKILRPEVQKKTIKNNLTTVEDFLNYQFSRKILQNTFDSPQLFLEEQFPLRNITRSQNIFSIEGKSFQGITNSIFLNLHKTEGGNDFKTNFDFRIIDQNLSFNDFTLINNGLTETELYEIAPTVSRLLYLHRSLGTDLANILLIHDQVQTKIILNHSDGKKKFVKNSYSEVLLSFNNYFKNKNVFFNFTEVTKINGHIEILGYLVVQDNEQIETADIRIHLDNNNKADLIMVFYYPDLSSS